MFSWGTRTLSCGMWDPVLWPGIKPGPPVFAEWSLRHWRSLLIVSWRWELYLSYLPGGQIRIWKGAYMYIYHIDDGRYGYRYRCIYRWLRQQVFIFFWMNGWLWKSELQGDPSWLRACISNLQIGKMSFTKRLHLLQTQQWIFPQRLF